VGDCTAGDHRDPARLDEGTTRAARRTRVPHSDWPPPQRRRRRSAPCDPQICCPTTMSIACRQDVHLTHATAHLCERCYAAASTSRSSPFGSATRPIGITHRGLVSRSDTALPVPLVGRVTVDSPSRNQPLRDVRSHCLRTVSAPPNVRRIRNSRAYSWVGLSRTHNCQVRGARVGSGPKLSR
jgi:hypothetical protein